MDGLGAFLKRNRESNDFTQEKAAEKIGVSVNTIQNWEKDECIPDTKNIKKLSNVYKVKWQDICSRIYEKNNMINAEVEDFPSYMFSEKRNRQFEDIYFTREQQELFELLFVYVNSDFTKLAMKYSYHDSYYSSGSKYYMNSSKSFPNIIIDNFTLGNIGSLPYKYIKDKGIIRIINMVDEINKIIEYPLAINIMDYISEHPAQLYSFKNINKYEISDYIDREYECNTVVLNEEEEIKTNSFTVLTYKFLKCIGDEHMFIGIGLPAEFKNYFEKKQKSRLYYESLASVRLSVSLPKFVNDYLINVSNDNFCFEYQVFESTNEEYIAKKREYEEKIKFYNENKDLHPEILGNKPKEYEEEFSVYIKVSDRGKKFIKWYEEIAEDRYKNKVL